MYLLGVLSILYIIDQGNAQTECLETVQGLNYLGKQNVSLNGPCENWAVALGNINYKQDSQFADITVANAQNYCRNPKSGGSSPYAPAPWCWLKSNSKESAYCSIPPCSALGVCRDTYLGETYKGNVSVSVLGNVCHSWNNPLLPITSFSGSNWPIKGETIAQASNYCRNPDKNVLGLWCYTQVTSLQWEPCMTTLCNSTLECLNATVPYSFKSLTSNEQYMQSCALWSSIPTDYYNTSSTLPSLLANATNATVNPYFNPALMPDLSLTEAQNYCRNPDNDTTGAWCYVRNNNNQYTKKYCKTPCSGIWACLYDRVGRYYQGQETVTESGAACQRWEAQSPQNFQASNFPDGSISAAANFCRNPDNNLGGPWCYIAAAPGTPNFGYCKLPTCLQTAPISPLQTSLIKSVCQNTSIGLEYTGTIATTISGKTCQSWSATTPQANPYFNRPILFNTSTIAEVSNYCRNPNRLLSGPWCYTTDANTKFESCNIIKCSPGPIQNCRLTLAGTEYNGTINVTASGVPCILWAQVANLTYNDSQFADRYITSAMNYCRNPKGPTWNGLFCYVINALGAASEQPCVVPMCNTSLCRNTSEGYTYSGNQRVTKSGKTCLPWTPRVGSIDPDMLPDATIDDASNFCRNPNKLNAFDGPFCYNSVTAEAETCGLTFCTKQCRNTEIGQDYAGIISYVGSKICRRWDDVSNVNSRNPATLNAGTLASASNYCRNPDGDANGIWCYTDPATKSYCIIPPCEPSGNCYTPNNAWAYNGTVNVTENNLPCIKWNIYAPIGLEGPLFAPSLLPEPIDQSMNYCRAPTTNVTFKVRPWCYLDIGSISGSFTPTISYGFCNVTICVPITSVSTISTSTANSATKAHVLATKVCYTPQNIASYNGYNNVTVSGTPCLRWAEMDSIQISKTSGPVFNASYLPGETIVAASNYCRVPTNQTQYNSQPWCYVNPAFANKIEETQNFGFCSVSFCNTTNSTGIFGSPAFNVFVAFTIVVSTFSLTNAATIFLEGSTSSSQSTTYIQSRPLPDSPFNANEIIPQYNNNAFANAPAQAPGGVPSMAKGSQFISASVMAENVPVGEQRISTAPNQAMIEAQRFQMNASEVPGVKVIGLQSNLQTVSNVSTNIMTNQNVSIPMAMQNKIVAEGTDETYSYSVGGNMETITISNVTKSNAAIIQNPKIIGEGSNEEYSYTVSRNFAQVSQQIDNVAFEPDSEQGNQIVAHSVNHNSNGNNFGSGGALRIISQGSEVVYSGGGTGGSSSRGGDFVDSGAGAGFSSGVAGGGFSSGGAGGGFSSGGAGGGFSSGGVVGVGVVNHGVSSAIQGQALMAGDVKQTKSIYYDINLNEDSGSGMVKKYEVLDTSVVDKSGGGVNIIREVKESLVSEQSVAVGGDLHHHIAQHKEQIEKDNTYYSILDDYNPLGST